MNQIELIDAGMVRSGMQAHASCAGLTYLGDWGNRAGGVVAQGTMHLVGVPPLAGRPAHVRLLFFPEGELRTPAIMIPDYLCEEVTTVEDPPLVGCEVVFNVLDEHPTAPVEVSERVTFVTSPQFLKTTTAVFIPQLEDD